MLNMRGSSLGFGGCGHPAWINSASRPTRKRAAIDNRKRRIPTWRLGMAQFFGSFRRNLLIILWCRSVNKNVNRPSSMLKTISIIRRCTMGLVCRESKKQCVRGAIMLWKTLRICTTIVALCLIVLVAGRTFMAWVSTQTMRSKAESAGFQFREVGAKAGINGVTVCGRKAKAAVVEANGSGVCWLDYNNDGLLDRWGTGCAAAFNNDGLVDLPVTT